MTGRSARLPLGSPTIPVPPPTRAMGVCPSRCSQASAHHRDHAADMEGIGRRIEAHVGGDGTLAQPLGEAGGGVLNEAAGVE